MSNLVIWACMQLVYNFRIYYYYYHYYYYYYYLSVLSLVKGIHQYLKQKQCCKVDEFAWVY